MGFTANAQKKVKYKKQLENGLYAVFRTSKGDIVTALEYQKTPMTVANFVGLAEGDFTFQDSIEFKDPFYDGLKFHRVIANFMIQGGDPQGNGMGGPGYSFYDETRADLLHDGPGVLSMANSGPATNGSQFFITHKETPWLNGKHTVFGHVVIGQNVVDSIQQNDTIYSLEIIRRGKEAKKFDATTVFNEIYTKTAEQLAKEAAEIERIAKMSQEEYKKFMYDEVLKKHPDAKQSESGLVYIIEKEGEGNNITTGDQVSMHYKGTFRRGGEKFDSSYDRKQPMDFKFKLQRMIPGFEEGVQMLKKGGKAKLVIPYYQAYGPKGRQGAIPPYSDLIFDIEIINVKPGSSDKSAIKKHSIKAEKNHNH